MLLSEAPGNVGANVPLHKEVGNENVGVTIGVTVKSNVAIESQPTAFVRITGYVPADGYELPFQLKGNNEAHVVIEVVLAEGWSTVTIIAVFPDVHCPGFGVNV